MRLKVSLVNPSALTNNNIAQSATLSRANGMVSASKAAADITAPNARLRSVFNVILVADASRREATRR